jgi:ATP-dependent Lon protease
MTTRRELILGAAAVPAAALPAIASPRLHPVMPLRDCDVLPGQTTPLFVGRDKSIRALEVAVGKQRCAVCGCVNIGADFVPPRDAYILLSQQKNAAEDHPAADAIHDVGTRARILHLLRLPDGTVKINVEGIERVRIVKYGDCTDWYQAEAVALDEWRPPAIDGELKASLEKIGATFEKLREVLPP